MSLAIFLYPQMEIDKPIDELIERGDKSSEPFVEPETTKGESKIAIPSFSPDIKKLILAKFLDFGKIKIERFKHSRRLTKEELDTYIKVIRKGGIHEGIENEFKHVHEIGSGSDLMKHITFDHLEKVLAVLRERISEDDKLEIPNPFDATEKKKMIKFSNPFMLELMNNKDPKIRERLIESSLGGLLNPDPRVRLICIHILRRLIPEPATWDFINERIKDHKDGIPKDPDIDIDASSLETVKKIPYLYNSIEGSELQNIVYVEYRKLWRFISRIILVKQIQKGDEKTIRAIPVEVFRLLSMSIDKEGYCQIPMNYFVKAKEVNVIIAGMKNKNKWIQEQCANSLIRIMRTRNIKSSLRRKIFNTLIKSQFRQKLLSGWSNEEIVKLNGKKKKKLLREYIRKNGYIERCSMMAEDQYDQPGDPIGYKPYKDNPLVKGEEVKSYKKDLEDRKLDKKEMLEKEYIFE